MEGEKGELGGVYSEFLTEKLVSLPNIILIGINFTFILKLLFINVISC